MVEVFGQEVSFELDEERNCRAVIDPEKVGKNLDVDLLRAIAEVIEGIVK